MNKRKRLYALVISCVVFTSIIAGSAPAISIGQPTDQTNDATVAATAKTAPAETAGMHDSLGSVVKKASHDISSAISNNALGIGDSASFEATTEESVAETDELAPDSSSDSQAAFTDAAGNPLTGEWRYEGVNYVFDSEGHVLAGGGLLGSKGRLYIPRCGIDVAVNSSGDTDAQYYTDLEDSAAYVRYSRSAYYLADHSSQAFVNLFAVTAGDVAYLIMDDGIEIYVCIDAFSGHNTGSSLTDASGNEITSRIPSGGFVAYTCQDDWTNIQITLWEKQWLATTESSKATVQLERKTPETEPVEAKPDDEKRQLPMRLADEGEQFAQEEGVLFEMTQRSAEVEDRTSREQAQSAPYMQKYAQSQPQDNRSMEGPSGEMAPHMR